MSSQINLKSLSSQISYWKSPRITYWKKYSIKTQFFYAFIAMFFAFFLAGYLSTFIPIKWRFLFHLVFSLMYYHAILYYTIPTYLEKDENKIPENVINNPFNGKYYINSTK